MKHWGLFLLAFSFAACHDDRPGDIPTEQTYYITPEHESVESGSTGLQARIAVSSNCNWQVGKVPEWCVVQKTSTGEREYLDITVQYNDDETPRNTEIPLLFGRGRASAFLSVSQEGKEPAPPLHWAPFPVNKLAEAGYELLEDQTTRRYRITGIQLFAAPGLAKQIYPGHLIGRRTDYSRLTAYDRYTYNPIAVTATNSKLPPEDLPAPSYEASNALAQKIIADLPTQNGEFCSYPVRYNSYRHLHLLGKSNLGLDLVGLINGGRPYTDKEMERQTGVIYIYAQSLFTIMMDYPGKLIEETVGGDEIADMVYINSVSYGRTALLLVESNADFTAVNRVISQIFCDTALSDSDSKIKNELTCRYVYFDNHGVHVTMGAPAYLIRRYIDEMQSAAVLPLGFTVNEFAGNGVGTMEVELELP